MTTKKILFYETNKPYGCFSNFAKFPIKIDGKVWPTTEHYFQAQKFVRTEHEELIRKAPTAMLAAKMGRERSRPLRPDWESCKDDVMRKALVAKVEQHQEVRETLLATGQSELIEHTSKDAYWADNGDGTGLNRLGMLLMEFRADLIKS